MLKAFFNRFSLRSVFIINVIIPLLIAMAAATYIGLLTLETFIEQRMQEDVQLVARAIRMPVSYSLEKERTGSVSQALQSVFRIGRVYGAYVYDGDGLQIAAVGAVEPDQPEDELLEVMEGGQRKGQYEKIKGHRVYSYFVPLFDTSGTSNGLLQVTRKKSDFEEYINDLRLIALVFLTGAGLFISVFVLFGFHWAAGRYFKKLTKSMERIEKGDRSHRARLKGPKEIVLLASSLNSMLDSRDRSEQEIAARREAQQLLENKLRQSEKMAAIGRLASGVAHELGAPLSLIDGKAQRCLRKPGMEGTLKSSLIDIRSQVQRMSDIVRQLLDFGKGSMRQKRWYRAGDLADSAVSTVRKETGGEVELLAQGERPGPELHVDPLRMEQALINLLRNAVQTGATRRVLLGWEQKPDKMVTFTIEDDGPGIPGDIRSQIFEPFFSTRKGLRNTGLGLSVVHGIIREHEGVIQVIDSALGGAGFRIILPVRTEVESTRTGEGNA